MKVRNVLFYGGAALVAAGATFVTYWTYVYGSEPRGMSGLYMELALVLGFAAMLFGSFAKFFLDDRAPDPAPDPDGPGHDTDLALSSKTQNAAPFGAAFFNS